MNPSTLTYLNKLRYRTLYSIIGFGIALCFTLPFSNQIYHVLSVPLSQYLPKGSKLIATDITSPFFIPIKLAIITAFILSLPHTLYQISKFITPALYKKERKILVGFLVLSIILFLMGVSFCYFIVFPVFFHFIGQFKANNIYMLTDISKYLDFVLKLFLIFGICFETPIVIMILARFEIINRMQLKKCRPYIFVGCFILAAVLTPPDVLSQTLLAIPLYLLYEIGIFGSKYVCHML
jgi:sec-independent protein translocase protein TatC